MRVLLIAADELFGSGIRIGLKNYQHVVDWVKTPEAALHALEHEHFEISIIDLSSIKSPLTDLLQLLYKKNIQTPVIVILGSSSPDERIRILDLGADDCLSKPFDLAELCARMRAIQRRSHVHTQASITVGSITLDPATRTVYKGNEQIILPRREFTLLQTFLANAGRVIPRDQLIQSIYSWADDIDSNAIEVHVHNLRKKFGTKTIKTVRAVGYMFVKAKEAKREK